MQDVIKNVRLYEKLKTKSMKLKADIIYTKSCKKEKLIPTFAKVNLALKSGGFKIKKKIAKLVMETEIQGKQHHIRKIRKDIRSLAMSLKSTLGVFLFNTVTRQAEVAIRSRLLSIKKKHHKKINNLRNNKRNYNYNYQGLLKNIEHLPENTIGQIKTKLGRICEN